MALAALLAFGLLATTGAQPAEAQDADCTFDVWYRRLVGRCELSIDDLNCRGNVGTTHHHAVHHGRHAQRSRLRAQADGVYRGTDHRTIGSCTVLLIEDSERFADSQCLRDGLANSRRRGVLTR